MILIVMVVCSCLVCGLVGCFIGLLLAAAGGGDDRMGERVPCGGLVAVGLDVQAGAWVGGVGEVLQACDRLGGADPGGAPVVADALGGGVSGVVVCLLHRGEDIGAQRVASES